MALKIFAVIAALCLVAALAQDQESQQDQQSSSTPQIKEGQFLLNIWRDKQTCEGAPTIPLSLMNDAAKCQVVLKDFFWAKGSCQGEKLTGQVCTDAQCTKCVDLSNVAPQNECTYADALKGAYKYTCSATQKNVTQAKQAQKPTQEMNQTIGEEAKQKLQEQNQTQGVESSETIVLIMPIDATNPNLQKAKKAKFAKTKMDKDNLAGDKFKKDQTLDANKNQGVLASESDIQDDSELRRDDSLNKKPLMDNKMHKKNKKIVARETDRAIMD